LRKLASVGAAAGNRASDHMLKALLASVITALRNALVVGHHVSSDCVEDGGHGRFNVLAEFMLHHPGLMTSILLLVVGCTTVTALPCSESPLNVSPLIAAGKIDQARQEMQVDGELRNNDTAHTLTHTRARTTTTSAPSSNCQP
jgi:hypothetical protein